MNTELNAPTMVVLDDGREQHQLLLDLSLEQLVSAIEELSQTNSQKQQECDKPSVPSDFILLKTGCDYTRQYDRIRLSDIAYITTEHRQTFLCLKNGLSFEMNIEEKDLCSCFPMTRFLRLRSNELINIDYIKSINDCCITTLDGHTLSYYAKYKPFIKHQLCLLGTCQKKGR